MCAPAGNALGHFVTLGHRRCVGHLRYRSCPVTKAGPRVSGWSVTKRPGCCGVSGCSDSARPRAPWLLAETLRALEADHLEHVARTRRLRNAGVPRSRGYPTGHAGHTGLRYLERDERAPAAKQEIAAQKQHGWAVPRSCGDEMVSRNRSHHEHEHDPRPSGTRTCPALPRGAPGTCGDGFTRLVAD